MRRSLLLTAAMVGIAPVVPACADVIDVAPDGATAVRSGMGAVVWSRPDAEIEPGVDVPEQALTTVADPGAVPEAYRAALGSSADRYALSRDLLAALVGRESAWRPGAVSPKGATGLAQLMPATARMLAVDPRDPAAAIDGGARYLRMMLDRFDGDVERALAAYNAGPGRVARVAGLPPIAETRAYVAAIVDRLSPAVSPATGDMIR